MTPLISVIVPTHNPDRERLRRTLGGLRAQTLPPTDWETILVNNASTRFPDDAFFAGHAPQNLSIVAESVLGLSRARMRGFAAALGEFAVLVDDDNVLAPDYLAETLQLFAAHPRVGAFGGRSLPEFETAPPAWTQEFFPLLALRDPGEKPLISQGLRPAGGTRNEYPLCAPIGAGMALRRPAWMVWLESRQGTGLVLSDRSGSRLTSSGDNDIVLALMHAGWEVGYFPQLSLTHLIPANRLEAAYLARLNRSIQQSWMEVLTFNDASPWRPLTAPGAGLRKIKAWFIHRPWRGPAAYIRWQGACGHFDGRIKQRS
ncbi:MAG: glycosyltransferase [Opitutaceae bacterium]|nr:glycosyltransferase [Opitutaceae bacterium]